MMSVVLRGHDKSVDLHGRHEQFAHLGEGRHGAEEAPLRPLRLLGVVFPVPSRPFSADPAAPARDVLAAAVVPVGPEDVGRPMLARRTSSTQALATIQPRNVLGVIIVITRRIRSPIARTDVPRGDALPTAWSVSEGCPPGRPSALGSSGVDVLGCPAPMVTAGRRPAWSSRTSWPGKMSVAVLLPQHPVI
jgi:hypothetical protein